MNLPRCLCKQICYYFCVNPKCKQPNAFLCKNKKYQCIKPHQNCTLKLWGNFSKQLKDMKNLFQTSQKFKKLIDQLDGIFKFWQNQLQKQKEQYLVWKTNYMSISLLYKFQKDLRQSNEKKWTGEQLSYLIKQPHLEKFKINLKNKESQRILINIQEIGKSVKNLYEYTADSETSFMSQINKSIISTRSKINSRQQQIQNSLKKSSLSLIKYEEPQEKKKDVSLKFINFPSSNSISPTKNNIATIQEQKEDSNNLIKHIKKAKNTSILRQSSKEKTKSQYELNRNSYRSQNKLERHLEIANLQNSSSKILHRIKSSCNFEKIKNEPIYCKLKQIYLQQINKKLRIIKNINDSLEIKFVNQYINYQLVPAYINQVCSYINDNSSKYQSNLDSIFYYYEDKQKESFTEFVDILKQFKFSRLKYIKLYYPHCITLDNSKLHQNLSIVLSRMCTLQLFLIITSQKNYLIKTYQNLGTRAKILVQNSWNMKQKWQ